MPSKRKSFQKDEPIDVSAKLAEALAVKSKVELPEHQDIPAPGDKVTVDQGKTVWTIARISHDGTEAYLQVPGTTLERNRVPIGDLNFVDRASRKPKAPEKSKIKVEEVRERIASVHHSLTDYLQSEIAVLRKWLSSEGISADEPLEEFTENTETNWKKAVKAIEEKLGNDAYQL